MASDISASGPRGKSRQHGSLFLRVCCTSSAPEHRLHLSRIFISLRVFRTCCSLPEAPASSVGQGASPVQLPGTWVTSVRAVPWVGRLVSRDRAIPSHLRSEIAPSGDRAICRSRDFLRSAICCFSCGSYQSGLRSAAICINLLRSRGAFFKLRSWISDITLAGNLCKKSRF